nr:MAG TPA: hypothetical protein [Caudoviricetes sp.]
MKCIGASSRLLLRVLICYKLKFIRSFVYDH